MEHSLGKSISPLQVMDSKKVFHDIPLFLSNTVLFHNNTILAPGGPW